jgi:kynureninase
MLTGFLEFLLKELKGYGKSFIILTPSKPAERGCQLSIFVLKDGRKVFKQLIKNNVIADWREPGVIRVAPVPLYNTFEEVFRFVQIFKEKLPA